MFFDLWNLDCLSNLSHLLNSPQNELNPKCLNSNVDPVSMTPALLNNVEGVEKSIYWKLFESLSLLSWFTSNSAKY